MRKGEFFATLLFGVLFGAAILLVIYVRNNPGTTPTITDSSTQAIEMAASQESALPTFNLYKRKTETPTPQLALSPAASKINEMDDVVLLYNPARPSPFSVNFCLIAQYYGLGCKKIEVTSLGAIKSDQFLDEEGKPYKLIGLDARLLETRFRTVGDRDVKMLMDLVKTNGVNLYLGKINTSSWASSMALFSDGTISEIAQPVDSTKDWQISADFPELTFELTGLEVISNQSGLLDTYELKLTEDNNIIPIISSKDEDNRSYAVFSMLSPEENTTSGRIFFDTSEIGQSIDKLPLWDIYYSAASFSQIVPLMMTMRYSYGDELWHSNANYANLTIDEGILIEPYQSINYSALVESMKTSHFHTTVALIPANWTMAQPNVVSLFIANSDLLSIAQYGNTGRGYEFYLENLDSNTSSDPLLMPTRSLDDQELSVSEGLSRLKLFENSTGFTTDRVMIFPGGISPESTFELLKQKGFLATVNVLDTPLGSSRPTIWDYGMYPAINNYAGFPNFLRRLPEPSQSYQPALFSSYLDLFIGKPVLFYTFPSDRSMFASGMDAFAPIADQINKANGDVSWKSLGYIASHLYSRKINDDGSLSIKMYAPELFLANENPDEKVIHISHPESTTTPVTNVTVNGYDFPFSIDNNLLTLDVSVPAGAEMRIVIHYDSQ
jgi:hypothetical protein